MREKIMNNIFDFTKRDLQRSDIHTLRNLARSVGVARPTSKKKEDLIADILAIVSGKEEPEYKNANRGRPAKFADSYSSGGFKLNLFAASPRSEYITNQSKTGVVVILGGKAKIKKLRFVDSNSDIEISAKDVKKYNLKDNDIVSYELIDGELSISKINDKQTEQKHVVISNKNIVYGKSNLLKIESVNQKKLVVDGLEGKIIVVPESNIDKYDGENITVLPMPAIEDKEIIFNFLSAISVATYYQKSGQQTVLVLSNNLNLLSSLQNLAGLGICEQVQEYLDRFLSSGGTFVSFVSNACTKSDDLLHIDNVN